MGDDIKYTLGLNTVNFLGPLRGAIAGLTAFLGIGAALGIAMRGVWQAIDEGGRLQDLSARTGVAVKDLYQLRTAFGQVGLSGEEVAPMVLRLQRAIAGMSDDGSKVGRVFANMGLDIEQLKQMGAAEQFQTIAETLSTLDRSSAVDAASKIFGRQGFGGIMSIAGDIQGFREGMEASAAAAAVFARSAAAFDRIGDTLALVRMRIQGMWAGVAEGIAPAIQSFVSALNGIDWVGIGTRVGSVFTAFGQAIQNGKLGELLSLSISVGIERVVLMFAEAVRFMGQLLVSTFTNAAMWKGIGGTMSASIADAIAGAWGLLGGARGAKFTTPGGGKLDTGGEMRGWQIVADAMRAEGSKALGEGVGKAIADWQKNVGSSNMFGPTALSQQWSALVASLAGGAKLPGLANFAPFGGQATGAQAKAPEANVLERIGFVFGGGASVQQQHAAATAQNTAKTNTLLAQQTAAIIGLRVLGAVHL